jgi:hypothetical protein
MLRLPVARLRRGTKFFILTSLGLACVALVGSARAWFAAAPPAHTETAARPPLAAQAAQPTPDADAVKAELITLTPRGFEPAALTRPKGRMLLVVDNRSGLREMTLRLDAEHGQRLKEIHRGRGRLDAQELLDLPPGRYLLTEAEHPAWRCLITLTAD